MFLINVKTQSITKMFPRSTCINIKFTNFKFYVNKDFEKSSFCKGVNTSFYDKVKNEE